ncbi:MAG: hypothetical protein MUF87_00960 [Anaerolineae bacterium]|jgi:hypothetical protein|nr:hypothetical protein [Anaerolineae bacterium]
MLNRVYWHISGRVQVWQMSGFISLEDVRDAYQMGKSLISDEVSPLNKHIIVDASHRDSIDLRLFNARTLQEILEINDRFSQPGWIIVVDPHPNKVMHFLLLTILKIAKARFRVFSTFDEALAFLTSVDYTLVQLRKAAQKADYVS